MQGLQEEQGYIESHPLAMPTLSAIQNTGSA